MQNSFAFYTEKESKILKWRYLTGPKKKDYLRKSDLLEMVLSTA